MTLKTSVFNTHRSMDLNPGSTSVRTEENQSQKLTSTSLFSAILMCSLAGIFYYYEYYLRVAPGIMKAELQEAFNISDFGFGYLSSCYYYPYILMQIPVGIMMDKFGPRKILTFACFLCVIGTFLFSHGDLRMAGLGRVLVGFGSAFAYVGVLKIATVWLPESWFPVIAGCCTGLGMLGAISGELIMTKLVLLTDWQMALDIAAWVGIILMLLLWLFINDTQSENASIARALELDVDGKVCSVSYSLWALLKSPVCWLNGMIGCLGFLPINAFAELWSVPYLQSLGYTKIHASEATALVFLGYGLGGPIAGLLSEKLKSRKIPFFIGLLLSSISMGILLWLQPSVSISLICLFCAGLFAGFKVMAFVIAHDLEQGINHATAIGFTNMLIMLGGAIAQPCIGKLLDFWRETQMIDGQLMVIDHYTWSLSILPIGLLLGAILICFMPESYHQRSGGLVEPDPN